MIFIKAFRAIDDLEACKKFAEGHSNVLRDYGVTKVTSANEDWFNNPAVYAIIVESEDGSEVYGGARIHLTGGTQPLPVEDAIGEMDNKIYDLVNSIPKGKTGELCGLWNAKAIAGSGISVLLTKACVAKAGVVIANQLKLEKLFVLCSPFTVKMVQDVGFEIEESLGNKGTFIYPKEDLIATLLSLNDTELLNAAEPFSREKIFSLRTNPVQETVETGPKGALDIRYNLFIPNL